MNISALLSNSGPATPTAPDSFARNPRWLHAALGLGAATFFYLHMFRFPAIPIWHDGGQAMYLEHAERMLHGEVLYRDLFQFNLPGTEYLYEIYPIRTPFKPVSGNYIYAKQSEDNNWIPIYIAQTRDLHQRLEGHVTLDDAMANGATHVHVHYDTAGQAARHAEERDLLLRWQPVCNDAVES